MIFQLPDDPFDEEDYDMAGLLAIPKPVKIDMRPRF